MEPQKREEVRRREPRLSDRPERPERFDRDRESGPNVLGFGNDVPAFMLIRKRGPAQAQVDVADSDDDLSIEETDVSNNEADIAA
jgi:hypothetical protein